MIIKCVDRHIGSRIRLRRKVLNISQYSLSYDLGISFQQLQKYESGENRVSASRLYEISKILKTSPHFFFDGLDGTIIDDSTPKDLKTMKAVEIMNKIRNQNIKDKILSLIIELEVQ
jgi:transcriptional regulator with XRE-family HTH domain